MSTELDRGGVVSALLGLCEKLSAEFPEDELMLLQAITLIDSNCAEAYQRLGRFYYDRHEWVLAIKNFEQKIEIDEMDFISIFYLANCHKNIGDIDMAINLYKKSLEVHLYPEGYLNLYNCYSDLKDKTRAYENLIRLVGSFPDWVLGHYNLGIFLYEERRLDEAICSFKRAVEIEPGHGFSKVGLAFAYLMNKNYPDGFAMYDSRWGVLPNCPATDLNRPYWCGEQVPSSSSILVTFEQGYGDALQMLRYIPMLQDKFSHVCVQVQPAMRRFVGMAFPAARAIVVNEDPIPVTDYYCPLMSLPRAFGTTYDTIPNTGCYLSLPDVAPFNLDLEIEERKKIGVCWRGGSLNPAMLHRSLSFDDLRSLFESSSFKWVSLTKELPQEECAEVLACKSLLDLTCDLVDFYETYRLVSQLDLVITVDTAIAHLAGAMGKPTIVILNESYDWRWHVHDEMSAWYPATKLLRAYKLSRPDDLVPAILNSIRGMSA